jgi:hypothetical protein
VQIPLRVGFPIRKSADQRLLASPRSLSQRATSFIASWRQGIHRTLLSRSSRTTHARTQDQAPRTSLCSPNLNAQLLLLVTRSRRIPANRTARAAPPTTTRRDQPFRFTCQTTPPPRSDPFWGSSPDSETCRAEARARPPGNGFRHSTLEAKPNTNLTSYGDGRYRTDGPLLAKQVLYH